MDTEIITRHEEHARVLKIGVATFRRHLDELMARGYPARKVGDILIADKAGILAWLRQGDGDQHEKEATPPAPTASPPASTPLVTVKRGRGRPRKHPLQTGRGVGK